MYFSLNPFINSLEKTLLNMAGLKLDNPKSIKFNKNNFFSDYTSCIGLIGKEKASLILTVTDNLAKRIVYLITGSEASNNESLIIDTISELLNITVGNAQKDLYEKFEFTLPISIKGTKHQIFMFEEGETLQVLFNCMGEEICIYLTDSYIEKKR
jgi:CheY-specific phosphatase CheX